MYGFLCRNAREALLFLSPLLIRTLSDRQPGGCDEATGAAIDVRNDI